MKILICFPLFKKEVDWEYALKITLFGGIYLLTSACIILQIQKVFHNKKFSFRYSLSKRLWILINFQKQNLQT